MAETGTEIIQVGRIAVPVVADYSQLDRELLLIEQNAKRAGKATGGAFAAGTDGLGRFNTETSRATEGLLGIAMVLGSRVVGSMRGLLGFVTRTASGLFDLGARGALKAADGLEAIAESTRDANGELSTTGKVTKAAAGGLEVVARTALVVSGTITGIQVAAATAAAGVAVLAWRASSDFVPAWNRVLTMLDGAPEDFTALRNQVSDLAGELGVDSVVAVDAFYEVLSALPELTKDTGAAVEILRVALKAGATGFTDTKDAVSAITGIIYNFNLSADQALEVSDALFKAQDLGALTFGEVASSISKAAPLVSALGGSYQDLLAITALVTRGQTSTSEAMTQVVSALGNLINESEKAKQAERELGVEFSASAIEAKGLAGWLLEIIDATEGNPEVLRKFFGDREAVTLLISLAQRTQDLRDVVKQAGESADQTEAKYAQMNEEFGRQKELLLGPYKRALRDIGLDLRALGVEGLKAANTVGSALRTIFAVPWADRLRGMSAEQAKFEDEWFQANRFNLGAQMPEFVPSVPRLDPVVVARPRKRAGEPTDLEHSREKVTALQNALQLAAVSQLALTGNTEEYEKAVASAQAQVNRLVVSEIERLRVAGVEEKAIAQLSQLYAVNTDAVRDRERASREAREEREALVVEAGQLRKQLGDQLTGLTATATDEAIRSFDAFERDLRARVKDLGQTLSAEEELGLRRIRESFAAQGTLEQVSEELRSITDASTGESAVAALNQYIDRLQDYIAAHSAANGALAEGTTLRAQFNDLLRAAYDQLVKNERALKDEALARKEAASDAAKENANAARRAEEERIRNLRDQARTLEENARAALQVAEAFGMIDSGAARALENVAQLGGAIARISGGDPTAIPSAIGAFAQIASSVIGGGTAEAAAKRQREREQLDATYRLTRALEELRRTMVLGISERERTSLLSEGGRLVNPTLLAENAARGRVSPVANDPATIDFLNRLEEAMGLEFFNQGSGKLDWRAFAEAWKLFQEMATGSFAQDLTGQLDALDYMASTLGDSLGSSAEQMQMFLDAVQRFSPEFAEAFGQIWKDQGAEAARAWLQDQARIFGTQGSAGLGSWAAGLTPDEIRRLLDEGFERLNGGGVTGGGPNTRLSVSITELQANQLLALESSQVYHLAAIHAILGGGRVPAPPSSSMASPAMIASIGGGGASYDLSGMTVEFHFDGTAPSPGDTAGWTQAGTAFGAGLGGGLAPRLARVARGQGVDPSRISMRSR